MTHAERHTTALMKWLAEDLYRERPHRGGYAMENPPHTCRIEFECLDDTTVRATARYQGALGGKGVVVQDEPSIEWLDEVAV